MREFSLITFCAFATLFSACGKPDVSETQTLRDDIRIVGSSTVYPFAVKVAQEVKANSGLEVGVKSTGSGAGHKLFCQGNTLDTPDITLSSRRQKKSEIDLCFENGVKDIIEIKLGYDGIVIANALNAELTNIRMRDIYMALAKMVPASDTDCTFRPNPNENWQEVNPDLPAHPISVYGPPSSSGTRDTFVELAMEGGAREVPCLASIQSIDSDVFARTAQTLREDGKWIDGGENDDALVQTLVKTPTSIGILGYSFLALNQDEIKGLNVDDTVPTFENISNGAYPVSRALYMYIKTEHLKEIKGLNKYVFEFVSEAASGPNGYLKEIGLVPLSKSDRAQVSDAINSLEAASQ